MKNYESVKMREIDGVCRTMLQTAAVLAAIEARTVVVLTCPRGHKITPVVLDVDGDGATISVRPIADTGRKSGSRAVADSPFPRAPTQCREAGCAESVRDLPGTGGWCDLHGSRPAVHIDHLATRFACRTGHRWTDRVTTARLLKSIALALVLGHDRASVTGSGVSRAARRSAVR